MKKCKLLITDLDGTLIETVSGKKFPQGIWDMRLKLDVLNAIKKMNPERIFIVSNQGGIELGFVNEDLFETKLRYVSHAIFDYTKIPVHGEYCASNNKDNECRKPNPGMIHKLMMYYEIDDEPTHDEILMIGDASGKEGQFSDSDKKTAENFGCEYMDVDDFVDKYKG